MPLAQITDTHLLAQTTAELGGCNPWASLVCYDGSLTTPPCSEGVTWLVMPPH